MMKLLSWNCRGLGHPSKKAALRELINSEKPEIILIQETKLDQTDINKLISQQRQYSGCASEARGASGGILTMWDNSRWICSYTNIHQNWIFVKLEGKDNGAEVKIYNVYSPNHYREKEACWSALNTTIEEDPDSNIIFAGDLNLVMHSNEKRGGTFAPDPYRSKLEHIMQEKDLVDIKPKNRRYTWSNKRIGAGNIMERLDRFLVNVTFLSTFSIGLSDILSSSASDHYPITLSLHNHSQSGPLPFRYSPLWNRIPAAREVVKQAWFQHVEGSPVFIWETKLKQTRQALKLWAKNNYQEPEIVKKDLKKNLESVQLNIEAQGLTQQAKENEIRLYAQLRQIAREEEIKWRIKSRQLWLRDGDKNTSYFHKQATVRKTRNAVSTIKDSEGKNHDTHESIKAAATSHFKKLLTEDKSEEDYSSLLQHMTSNVTQEINSKLIQEIEEEEVHSAIWSLHPDKAPGPDGFSISFYREFWHLIKKDLLKMIRWSLRKGKLGGSTNSTYLALIPKENRPSTFSRFRPISLCNSAYKIIAKILSARLKPHLTSLISENQGGFLPNRHISDSILLVQEAIHSSMSKKEKGFVLKLDLANAFDRVRHSFLFAVLHKMGFNASFISMIKACISNPWISPLINGRPCEAFQSSRGLKQGCPLSPYLFILMAESLSKSLDYNRRVGLITGIQFAQGTKNINHSQFADDTLLMGGASITIARRFKKILDQFMAFSSGMINQVKSCVYGWNASHHTIHSIASILRVSHKLEWNNFTYLGMPVGIGPLKTDTWSGILDKIKRKIQHWGSMWLNPAGRLVLLKSGLISLPIYRFSLIQAPMAVHHKMEKALRHFLWQGGKAEKKKFNLVNWKSVIQPLEKGGLGIRSPHLLNLALGAKMVWRLITGDSVWWKAVLEAKYLNSTRDQLLDTNIPIRDSSNIWKLCKKTIPFIAQNISKTPGEGSSISISMDRILGQNSIGSNKEAVPAINWLNNRGIWNLAQITQWGNQTHSWTGWSFPNYPKEIEASFLVLENLLHSKAPVQRGSVDSYRWDPTGTLYTAKAGYQRLCENTFPQAIWIHWKLVWKAEAPPKIKFFFWLLLKGKILTAENLKKRGIQGPSRCPNCCQAEETIQHLFIDCQVAKRCWNNMATIGEVAWEPRVTIADSVLSWKKICPWKGKKSNLTQRIWNTIPLTLVWSIWLARNKKVFQDKDHNLRIICHKAKTLAVEAIISRTQGKIEAHYLSTEERNLLNYGPDNVINVQALQKESLPQNEKSKGWKLRLKEEEFVQWLSNCNRFHMFFDGASKSNPGKAGAGGLICNGNGVLILQFEWGLGELSNNRAEGLALFQGLVQLLKLGIKKATIFGDSAIIIRLMALKQSSPNILLQQINNRNHILNNLMEETSYFHILRGLNKKADSFANRACDRPKGQLSSNDILSSYSLP